MKTGHSARKNATLHHLNRIEGQLRTLRQYIEKDKPCADISALATSIAKSFDTLRVRTLEGFIINELVPGELIKKKQEQLALLLKLFKQ